MRNPRYAVRLEIATVQNVLHDIGVNAISVKTVMQNDGTVGVEIIGTLSPELIQSVEDASKSDIGFNQKNKADTKE